MYSDVPVRGRSPSRHPQNPVVRQESRASTHDEERNAGLVRSTSHGAKDVLVTFRYPLPVS